ncbi:hypothetical protein M427DRAFT_45651 [Gonapodya prolifera JEL478]|uniref:Uncharacterized protein n=1 Tax=Gonapodya prolifera (strain JEL478) TaxID=1344416 RepID=A0A139A9L4_GONPJ|nr:hypothetical protein M427DRAFT_45651 [Gonapodya prolifera JEL478]|eukprot:KXS13521.1 hypothetical protein M427DRAFT_45651 [Gonapodya prolifera JEL478]
MKRRRGSNEDFEEQRPRHTGDSFDARSGGRNWTTSEHTSTNVISHHGAEMPSPQSSPPSPYWKLPRRNVEDPPASMESPPNDPGRLDPAAILRQRKKARLERARAQRESSASAGERGPRSSESGSDVNRTAFQDTEDFSTAKRISNGTSDSRQYTSSGPGARPESPSQSSSSRVGHHTSASTDFPSNQMNASNHLMESTRSASVVPLHSPSDPPLRTSGNPHFTPNQNASEPIASATSRSSHHLADMKSASRPPWPPDRRKQSVTGSDSTPSQRRVWPHEWNSQRERRQDVDPSQSSRYRERGGNSFSQQNGSYMDHKTVRRDSAGSNPDLSASHKAPRSMSRDSQPPSQRSDGSMRALDRSSDRQDTRRDSSNNRRETHARSKSRTPPPERQNVTSPQNDVWSPDDQRHQPPRYRQNSSPERLARDGRRSKSIVIVERGGARFKPPDPADRRPPSPARRRSRSRSRSRDFRPYERLQPARSRPFIDRNRDSGFRRPPFSSRGRGGQRWNGAGEIGAEANEVKAGVGVDMEAGAEAEVEAGAGAGLEVEAGVLAEDETRSEVGAEAVGVGAEAGVEVGVEAGVGVGVEADTGAGAEAKAGRGTEVGPEAGPEAGPGVGRGVGRGVGPGVQEVEGAGVGVGVEAQDHHAAIKALVHVHRPDQDPDRGIPGVARGLQEVLGGREEPDTVEGILPMPLSKVANGSVSSERLTEGEGLLEGNRKRSIDDRDRQGSGIRVTSKGESNAHQTTIVEELSKAGEVHKLPTESRHVEEPRVPTQKVNDVSSPRINGRDPRRRGQVPIVAERKIPLEDISPDRDSGNTAKAGPSSSGLPRFLTRKESHPVAVEQPRLSEHSALSRVDQNMPAGPKEPLKSPLSIVEASPVESSHEIPGMSPADLDGQLSPMDQALPSSVVGKAYKIGTLKKRSIPLSRSEELDVADTESGNGNIPSSSLVQVPGVRLTPEETARPVMEKERAWVQTSPLGSGPDKEVPGEQSASFERGADTSLDANEEHVQSKEQPHSHPLFPADTLDPSPSPQFPMATFNAGAVIFRDGTATNRELKETHLVDITFHGAKTSPSELPSLSFTPSEPPSPRLVQEREESNVARVSPSMEHIPVPQIQDRGDHSTRAQVPHSVEPKKLHELPLDLRRTVFILYRAMVGSLRLRIRVLGRGDPRWLEGFVKTFDSIGNLLLVDAIEHTERRFRRRVDTTPKPPSAWPCDSLAKNLYDPKSMTRDELLHDTAYHEDDEWDAMELLDVFFDSSVEAMKGNVVSKETHAPDQKRYGGESTSKGGVLNLVAGVPGLQFGSYGLSTSRSSQMIEHDGTHQWEVIVRAISKRVGNVFIPANCFDGWKAFTLRREYL